MTVQAKPVDPNGKPKAVVATHDRVHAGKEFQLFTQLINVMAISAIPTEGFSPNGYQLQRLITPTELVDRALDIATLALKAAAERGWIVETSDIDELYEDHGVSKKAGF